MKTMFKNPPQYKRITPILVDDILRRHYVYLFPNGYLLHVSWDSQSEAGGATIGIRHYDSTFGEFITIDPRSYIPLAGYAETRVYTKRQLIHWLNFVYTWPSDKHFSKKFLLKMRRRMRMDKYEGAFNKFPKITRVRTEDISKFYSEEELKKFKDIAGNIPTVALPEEFRKKFQSWSSFLQI